MASLRQIEANRRNAQKSTGPKSSTGKAASRLNALKTGIYSDAAVLPCEDRAEHDALVADYYARFSPTVPEERVWIDEIIRCEWTLRRLHRAEAELNSYVHECCFRPDPDFPLGQPAATNPKVFSSLQWRINATRKAKAGALACLRDLRQHPIPESAPLPESGESAPPPPPSPQPPQNQPLPGELASNLNTSKTPFDRVSRTSQQAAAPEAHCRPAKGPAPPSRPEIVKNQ